MDNIITAIISIVMVILTTTIFYEIMRLVWQILPKLKVAPRKRIIFVVLAIFGVHTISVWLYGITYWIVINQLGIGFLHGSMSHEELMDAVYFSAVTYSSLGFGDVTPKGAIRMICGVEVLNGLVLIGWSISFTYLAMEKFWVEHHNR